MSVNKNPFDENSKDKDNDIEKLPLDYLLNKNEITKKKPVQKKPEIVNDEEEDEFHIPSDTVISLEEAERRVKFEEKVTKKESGSKDNSEIVFIGLKLMAITFVMALILAVINYVTFDRISSQTQAEKDSAMQKIFASAEFEQVDIKNLNLDDNVKNIYSAKSEGVAVGYCVNVTTNGFGGAIELIVGVNKNKKVEGISVISHSETPNIGTKPLSDSFLDKFKGISYPFEYTKTNQGINAISGATITSNAVKKGIDTALIAVDTVMGVEGNE